MNKELNLNFETWLESNYNENILNLSWNEYVERSKEYNDLKKEEKND